MSIVLQVSEKDFEQMKEIFGKERAESFIKPKRTRKKTEGGYSATKARVRANKEKIKEFMLHTKKPTAQDIADHIGVSRTTLYSNQEYKLYINTLYMAEYQMKLI